jgi:hypothetical protein
MNTPKITERAVAVIIRQYADALTATTTIRPFQCLSEDRFKTDEAGGTRSYPMIEIRATPPQVNASQHTEHVDVSISIANNNDDDQNHEELSMIYGSVLEVLQKLHKQSLTSAGGAELTTFKSVFSDEFGNDFNFGGITFEGGMEPFDDDGVSVIGQTIQVHYSRR